MITLQLWAGVVFLIVGGVVGFMNCRHWMYGRYDAETYSDGLDSKLWWAIRWFWVFAWAGMAVVCFSLAIWLIRYILTQPI